MYRLICLLGLLVVLAAASLADPPIKPPEPASSGIGRPGKVTIDGSVAVDTPTSATYTNAHLVTDNGSTLDASTLKALINPSTNTMEKVVATGNVKGTFTQAITHRTYTVFADQGIYDPKLDQIHLTGSVRILVESTYTQGPLVQTGTSALVQLGNGPDFPTITTNDAKTVFTLSQQ